jgi:hypothetical protein
MARATSVAADVLVPLVGAMCSNESAFSQIFIHSFFTALVADFL